jgi:hypothetical protein
MALSIWYDYHMESKSIGALLETAYDTVCWRSKAEFAVPKGQLMLFIHESELSEKFHHMRVSKVIHPCHGAVECLSCDLKNVENVAGFH